ncbi:SMI1/KNR4 family protein [Chitinophaga sp. CB10]|uniref:SMI1/KNR4 family protein n=1 Tax=Chitinophaga sp. CB10 TaxID=1891659 RepID=UPI0025BC1566|nr:SMI1/KNR4 family protein [Chitinophaga sp. CB10]
MGLETLKSNINRLIDYWTEQGLVINSNSLYDIDAFESRKHIHLPDDFKEYFSRVNGMPSYYPNNIDNEGFLFYPLEKLVTLQEEFAMENAIECNSCILIFAEYMHKSWWYGVQLNDISGNYEIGIIPDKERFKSITASLSTFIDLYLQNASVLYQYE